MAPSEGPDRRHLRPVQQFNWNTEAGRDVVTGTKVVNGKTIPTFAAPNNILSPRIFKLGVRYSF